MAICRYTFGLAWSDLRRFALLPRVELFGYRGMINEWNEML